MGKLFSSILLDRMLHFKNLYCPDPKEQLGFCKGAQTNDHIFTLKTVIDKYTRKHKVRVYACFVDLRKAFDTVCRDLLLHKITCLGISGNFFNCLTDMYLNSVARIKISKLLIHIVVCCSSLIVSPKKELMLLRTQNSYSKNFNCLYDSDKKISSDA